MHICFFLLLFYESVKLYQAETDVVWLCFLSIFLYIFLLFFLDISTSNNGSNHQAIFLSVAKSTKYTYNTKYWKILRYPQITYYPNKIKKCYPGKLIGGYFALLDDYAKLLWSVVLNGGVARGGVR